MLTLQNSVFKLNVDVLTGRFDLIPGDQRFPALTGLGCGARYRVGRKPCAFNVGTTPGELTGREMLELPEQGAFERVTLAFPADENGLRIDIQIGILQEYPLVLWKLLLCNEGKSALNIQRIDLLNIDPRQGGRIKYTADRDASGLGFFSNGWQSWSPSRWYRADEQMQISNLHGLQTPMIYNPGTPRPRQKGVFSSDMFAVLTDNRSRTGPSPTQTNFAVGCCRRIASNARIDRSRFFSAAMRPT